jgi:predicted DNA-binding protein
LTALKSSNKVVPLAHIWDFKMARHRLTLSISPELKHALDELNDATGVAAASFVGEIIEGNIAMIQGIADAARKAKEEPARALELMQRAMLEALHGVSEVQLELMDKQAKLRTFQRKDGEE